MSRIVLPLFLFAVILIFSSAPAQSGIVVTVDKTAQRLTVEVDGAGRYKWPVSTGRWGYSTPNGSYRPQRLARKWFSRKYDWAPMPYSIFFNEGYAIHGSYEVSRLGKTCVAWLHSSVAFKCRRVIRASQGSYRRHAHRRYRRSAGPAGTRARGGLARLPKPAL